MPSTLPDNTQRPPDLTSAFKGRNKDYTQEHTYTNNSSSGGDFGNASYSYGPDGLPNIAKPSLKPSLPNNGTGRDDQFIYSNRSQSYAYAPSQQLLPLGQVESITTDERDATGQPYFLPNPPDATPPSTSPQVREFSPTQSHTLSLPILADALPAPANSKGRRPRTTKPAAPKAAKADKKPAARGHRAAPTASAAEQDSVQAVTGALDAKAPAKKAPKRKSPLPELLESSSATATVTQPVSGSTKGPAPAAAQESQRATAASVDKSRAASGSSAAIQSDRTPSRSQSRPAGGAAVQASHSSTTLNKRKRDEQDDDVQRDRDLMPPPAAPHSNVSIGKGKGRATEPPASIAGNNQVNPNVITSFDQTAQILNYQRLQFVPCGPIAFAPRVDPRYPAAGGLVWIVEQITTGLVWPAKLHTGVELADLAYRKAFNSAYQRIVYLPRRPGTDNGKVLLTDLILISLEAPLFRNQVLWDARTIKTAQVIPPEYLSRFLEQLHIQESRRRAMMYKESSSGFGGPVNMPRQAPYNAYPHVGPSNPQYLGHSQSPFPSSSTGYPSNSTSIAYNYRFLTREQGGIQPNPYRSSTFSFHSEAQAAGPSTPSEELPYPFSSYPSPTVNSVTPSGSGTPTGRTASSDSIGDAYCVQDPVVEAPDSVLGDVDFFTNLPPSTNAEEVHDDTQIEAYPDFVFKAIMALPDEQFKAFYLADDDSKKKAIRAFFENGGASSSPHTPLFDHLP